MNVKMISIILSMGLAFEAQATHGMRPVAIGAASKGMAGAGQAIPSDNFVIAQNPAGMSEMKRKEFDASLSLFNPNRSYSSESQTLKPNGQTVESGNPVFLIPSFGFSSVLNENVNLGFAMYAKGGGSVVYKNHATFGNYGQALNISSGNDEGVWTTTDLNQMAVAPAAAIRLNDNHAVGFGPLIGLQRFKATGLGYFIPVSDDPQHLTDNGYDYSYGAGWSAGYHGNYGKHLSFSAGYQSRIEMSRFQKYAGLFADHGEFDMAPELSLGLGLKVSRKFKVAFDYQRLYYSDIPALANGNQQALAVEKSADEMEKTVGSAGGAGFGWEDVNIYKVGMAYEFDNDLIVRAGYSYGNSPIGSEDVLFNILAPAVSKQHIGVGVGQSFKYKNNDYKVDMAYVRTLKNSVAGNNPNNLVNEDVELSMDQHDVELGISVLF